MHTDICRDAHYTVLYPCLCLACVSLRCAPAVSDTGVQSAIDYQCNTLSRLVCDSLRSTAAVVNTDVSSSAAAAALLKATRNTDVPSSFIGAII